MKRLVLIIVLALVVASPAMAGTVQVGYSGSGYGIYQTGRGGEFTLVPYDDPGRELLDVGNYYSGAKDVGVTGSFQTFCIEGGEVIYPYDAIYSVALSDNAMYGQEKPDGDPVSLGTAWLYAQFATNSWSAAYGLSYNYGSNRTTSAQLLQNAIWWLEGEENIAYDATNMYMKAVTLRFSDPKAANTLFAVKALNLGAAGQVQDQLFYKGGPTFNTPDGGATVMLLGGALVGLGALRRKFRG